MKNLKSIYLLVVICFFVLYGCGKKKQGEKFFFDIPGYFKHEIEYIKTNFSSVSKISVYNGDTSQQQLKVNEVNWEKEFALFLKSDINKPLYVANMHKVDWPLPLQVDSSVEKQGYSVVANNKNLDIQEVGIGKIPQTIEIIIRKSNLLSETLIKANYMKDSAYSILGEQHLKGFSNNTFLITGKLNK